MRARQAARMAALLARLGAFAAVRTVGISGSMLARISMMPTHHCLVGLGGLALDVEAVVVLGASGWGASVVGFGASVVGLGASVVGLGASVVGAGVLEVVGLGATATCVGVDRVDETDETAKSALSAIMPLLKMSF